MKLEPVFSSQTPPTPLYAMGGVAVAPTASTLQSPEAPRTFDRIIDLCSWVFSKFLSLFSWILPAWKEENNVDRVDEEFLLAVQQAQAAEAAALAAKLGLVIQASVLVGMYKFLPFDDFVAMLTIPLVHRATRAVANRLFPTMPFTSSAGSMLLSNAVVWKVSQHFNRPYDLTRILPLQAAGLVVQGLALAAQEEHKAQATGLA